MAIGNNLKTLRTKKNMTQKELAEALNVSYQAVSRWENDEVEPDISTLSKLSEIFGVSVDAIISGKFEEAKTNDDAQTGAALAAAVAAVAVAKQEEQQPVRAIRVCDDCHRDIQPNEICHEAQRKRDGSVKTVYICQACHKKELELDARKNNMEIKEKKEKKHGLGVSSHKLLIWSIVVGVAVFGILLGVTIAVKANIAVILIVPLVLGYLMFADIYCIFGATWVGDVFTEVASWSIKLPGIIFTFDLDGLAFLIVMKILFAIIGFFVGVATFLLALGLSMICAFFTFPFVAGKLED